MVSMDYNENPAAWMFITLLFADKKSEKGWKIQYCKWDTQYSENVSASQQNKSGYFTNLKAGI